MKPKVAYLMSRFPHLPETFILREMEELEHQGFEIFLYPLIYQEQQVVHQSARAWMPRAHRVPFASPALLGANFTQLFRQPARFIATWGRALVENLGNAKFLLRTIALLPKATYMAHLMQKAQIEHIHAHYATHPALAAWVIHRLTGVSYSVTVHAHDIFVPGTMLATKLGAASLVIAISQFNVNFLTNLLGAWIREKCHVVHCGIDSTQYHPRTDSQEQEDTLRLANIGSLQPYKGQQYLIEACALLRDRGIPVHCRIIGGGEERPQLKEEVDRLKLDSVVEFTGPLPQEEVSEILPEADCYVQPSVITPSGKMEGIPVALMEALACALPTVATAISGIPELVRPDETGYLVDPENALALADTIATVYFNPEQAARLGRHGRAMVIAEFDLKRNVATLASLFNNVIAACQPEGPKHAPLDTQDQ